MNPPYYSLLRALESRNAQAAPRAYILQGQRVWVRVGYSHPLAERIRPDSNQMLLIGPPHEWTYLDEAPFRDIYEVLEFALPRTETAWTDVPVATKIRVPLTLAPGGSAEAGQLWVLSEDGVSQLDAFVGAADDALLARLAFAVGGSGEQPIVVLRARPSREPPPVLVLRGLTFRPYLKLPNLFLPVGRRLHPPLRREAAARLLAPDHRQITWLNPTDGNGFTLQSIPDDAFRPLADWVEYVLDHEQQTLQAWVASCNFDFEPFVCQEDRPRRSKKSPTKKQAPVKQHAIQRVAALESQETAAESRDAQRALSADRAGEPRTVPEPSPSRTSEVEMQLRSLETRFSGLDSPPDAEERRPLWHAMARLSASLKHRRDATICWSNALWEVRNPAPKLAQDWFEDEKRSVKGLKLSDGALPALLQSAALRPLDAAPLAAYLVAAAQRASPPPELTSCLGEVAIQLERQETHLPVRAAWLAWAALTRLTGGDVLALVKARDRALERLHQHGLRPEIDLPLFLRTASQPDTERIRIVRENLNCLRQQAHRWLANGPPAAGKTAAYADLMFAYALARVGETTAAGELLRLAQAALCGNDEVHQWLSDAFAYRIRAASEGRSSEPLPGELLDKLRTMETTQSYKIERFRAESRILEPFEKFYAYRRHTQKEDDALGWRLLHLIDESDRDRLYAESQTLLREFSRGDQAERARVLTVLLQLAPRLGEAFAREVLALAVDTLQAPIGLQAQIVLLERGLLLAAHFEHADYVQNFVEQLHQLISQGLRENRTEVFDSALAPFFRSLRKLGMREEIDGVIRQLTELISRNADPQTKSQFLWFVEEAARVKDDTLRSKNLTHVGAILTQIADTWFYNGQSDDAANLLEQIRKALLQTRLAEFWRLKLAASFATAHAQVPAPYALKSFEGLFAGLTRGETKFAAYMTHYSVSDLVVIEAALLALLGDGIPLNARSRRWLEDDEYVVRRRIHRDVREALADAESGTRQTHG